MLPNQAASITAVFPFIGVSSFIAFSMVSAAKGYEMIVCIPKGYSEERTEIMKAYGTKVIYVKEWRVDLAVSLAKQLSKKPKHYMPNQFENPWNIEDAFMAAAVKLARGGANVKTRATEIAASKAYYSGNSRCSSAPCNSYANAIQRKAAEIEKNL